MNTELTRVSRTFAIMAGISFVCGLLIISTEGKI